MEFEQPFEKKLKAYKRKKAEYEMLEEAEIEDESLNKNTVPEIIEALISNLDATPVYNVTDFPLMQVAESIDSYSKETYAKFQKLELKKLETERKQLDKALKDYLNQPGEKLCDFIARKVREMNLKAPEVYKPVLMRKQTYSRLISNRIKEPTFETCVQLMLRFHSDIEEANKILRLAGRAFSDSEYHRTVKYFIENKEYSIDALNEALMKLNYEVIGCK